MNDARKQVQTASLANEWANYRERVTPPDAGEVQVQESRRAFYAGAWAVLCVFVAIGESEVPEEEGVDAIERMHKEAVAFKDAVVAGRA